ncbi:hypothetical protein PHYBLDRAFT_162923 [Phycomyces blakesleeanus NRRL 1555(-)]|uniref:Uncharacterized protein n=1 Tax=Phycomyces blakesleeanus (strain ATCC 8743b / DSM 1359 / FGSC 10004 / NBRC 33097 / NRRL 1555) TaxID=763407 RepID=A0A167QL55_PHYB8|nr:hypothetical protein PHYBLDRAFT_162923 [Phycomyces blakesleeanus NRRL 1555(-)]OAD79869.1 hypothetical protein PHYBLDRAFT_162923 [Phycomyces blakesleeanus NRRL 1555(-)]|eukprot:XP_018297909.1 hypothetical protein PHYBLDRAFT_162923 [Phycomyces blakesleeanus NRRL 1555(-)]
MTEAHVGFILTRTNKTPSATARINVLINHLWKKKQETDINVKLRREVQEKELSVPFYKKTQSALVITVVFQFLKAFFLYYIWLLECIYCLTSVGVTIMTSSHKLALGLPTKLAPYRSDTVYLALKKFLRGRIEDLRLGMKIRENLCRFCLLRKDFVSKFDQAPTLNYYCYLYYFGSGKLYDWD